MIVRVAKSDNYGYHQVIVAPVSRASIAVVLFNRRVKLSHCHDSAAARYRGLAAVVLDLRECDIVVPMLYNTAFCQCAHLQMN